VLNCECEPSDDDALCLAGDCHGSVVVGYEQRVQDWTRWNHGVVAYTGQETGTAFQPLIGQPDGYAGQFIRCDVTSTQPPFRVMGGVWQLIDCDITISPIAGIDAVDAQVNLIGCRFHSMPAPANPPYGYLPSGPCPIRVQSIGKDGAQRPMVGRCRIWSANCSLDGVPMTTNDLCRMFADNGYAGAGSGAAAIRRTPN
jgi:hypothetical protein